MQIEIEEVEVDSEQYATMLSYPSSQASNLTDIIEETEEESDEEEGDEERLREQRLQEDILQQQRLLEEQDSVRRRREEEERKREEEERQRQQEKAKKDAAFEEEFREFEARFKGSLSDINMTGTMRRRLIKRTPSVAVISEEATAQVMLITRQFDDIL